MTQQLNDEFSQKPLEFMKKHPVEPPSDLGQKLTNLSTIFDENNIGQYVKDTSTKSVSSAETKPEDYVLWVDFNRSNRPATPDAITFAGTKKATIGHVPIYFLPWRSMHVVSMTIPELRRHGDESPSNPNIFFTAAINGCSVFVRGKPTSPEVYHAGIDGRLTLEATAFWRDCLSMVLKGPTNKAREVNKTHYVKDARFKGRANTPLADEYLRWLEDKHRERLTIQEVAPWGCVFGIRYGRLWSFYLQENSTVTTLEFTKKSDVLDPSQQYSRSKSQGVMTEKLSVPSTGLFGMATTKTVYALRRTTTRPMRVSEFYPGGPGSFSSQHLFSKVL